MSIKIILSADKQQKIIHGHPWVFPNAIQKIIGQPQAGDWVEVLDAQQNLIGAGFYNPHSLYRVRLLANQQLIQKYQRWQDILKYRLEQAIQLRKFFNLPNSQTNAYRLCNSESDGLSGLVIDIFNDVTVISSSAYWVERQRPIIQAILREYFPEQNPIWIGQEKPLKQDGWDTPHRDDPQNITTIAKEAGILFEIHFDKVQKTGIYLDQRENHERVAQLCKGKKVLDLYTYHGGFALHAAKAGASQVTAVDSSAAAIEHAKRNAKLNQVEQIQWLVEDAKKYLDHVQDYDVIILDPPKLVPSKKHLHQAKNLYRFLHRQVFRQMQSGSILMTCNCSSALSTTEFIRLVSEQAIAEQRQIQILGSYGPSICHPILPMFPEGHYLTAVLVCIL